MKKKEHVKGAPADEPEENTHPYPRAAAHLVVHVSRHLLQVLYKRARTSFVSGGPGRLGPGPGPCSGEIRGSNSAPGGSLGKLWSLAQTRPTPVPF